MRRAIRPPPRCPTLGLVWGSLGVGVLSIVLLLLVLAADVLTTSSLVFSILLSVPIAFSALALSRRLTLWLVGAALAANTLAGVLNAAQDHATTEVSVLNRVFSGVACVLVGLLVLHLQDVAAQAASSAQGEARAARESALRGLVTRVSAQESGAAVLARAVVELRELLGARVLTLGALAHGELGEPYASDPPGVEPLAAPGSPLPPGWLLHPNGPRAVSLEAEGGLLAGRWRRRNASELLVLAGGAYDARLLDEALGALEPLLDQAALLEDLRGQRRELERRHAVIRDLVYAFSHDLRTPLIANALVMRLAVQGAYGPLDPELQRSLVNGLGANQDLLDLAEKLLVVARLEGGEPPLDVASLDLADVVRRRARELEPRLRERNLTLNLELRPAFVSGSAADLRRVAQNLLDNAAKFSPPGGIISARVAREGREAVLSVRDAGPGVAPDVAARLFQRFRGGGAGAGSGLGLYLARSIVQAHGGSITYHRDGGESVFEARLPLSIAAPEAEPALEARA